MTISDFGFRIADFRPPTRGAMREGASAMTGGAWHPDSPRIGVPGILSDETTPEPELGKTKDS